MSKLGKVLLSIGIVGLWIGYEAFGVLSRFGCYGPYQQGEDCWQAFTRPSVLGWLDLRSYRSPNEYIRRTMIREPWHPFLVDCMSEGGSGEECVYLLPPQIRELQLIYEQKGSLSAWYINEQFPWRRQLNACVIDGETERQCIDRLSPNLLEKLEEWEQKQAQGRRAFHIRNRERSTTPLE